MSNVLAKTDVPELKALEKGKAAQIKATFEPMVVMLQGFEDRYNELMAIPLEDLTPELCEKFKRFRLDVAKVRIDTGKAKDKAKEYLKLEDRAIMGVHNILVYSVKEMEDSAKERELYFETLEKQRLEALQIERAEKLSAYVADAHERDLAKFAEDEFEALFSMKKKESEDRIAAELKAEEERIAKEKAEEEARELMRKENERLKAEAEAKEKAIAKERAKAEAEIKAIEDAARKEREAARVAAEKAAKEWAALEAEMRAKEEAIQKAQREADARAEAERKAKEEADRKAREEEDRRVQAELSKGDAEKVNDLIESLNAIKTKFSFESKANQKMYADVCILIDKINNHIKGQAENL